MQMPLVTWRCEHTVTTVAIVAVAPILLFAYPPMTDFPAHEAIVAILRHRREAAYIPELYQSNWGHPNQLFYLLAWGLSYPFGVTGACKLVVAASIVAIFHYAARLARHVERDPAAAHLVAPAAFGWFFLWGFVNQLVGLAALLAVLPTFDRFSRDPTRRQLGWVLIALLLLYATHEIVFFLAFGILGLFTLRGYSTWAQRGRAFAPLPCAIVLAGIAAIAERPLMPPSNAKNIRPIFDPLAAKLAVAPTVLTGQFERAPRWVLCALSVTSVVAFLIARYRTRHGDGPRLRFDRAREWIDWYRFELVVVACAVLYLAAPSSLYGTTWLYHRFLVIGWCLAAPIVGPRVGSVAPWKPLLALAVVVPLSFVALIVPSFATSNRLREDLNQVLSRIPPGSAVANIALWTAEDRTSLYQPAMMSDLVVAELGGRVIVSFLDSPISPVYIRQRYQWNDVRVRNDIGTALFRPEEDLRHFDFALVQCQDRAIVDFLPAALSPESEWLLDAGDWHLFRSRIALSGPVSPDWSTKRSIHGTLYERLKIAGMGARATR
jgi:hypothetical protein